MKKILICLLLTGVLCLATAGAQNFADNDYQKAGRAYEQQAGQAMDAGDYDKAANLADLAADQYRKSREFADTQLLKFRAANAINLAQQTITDIDNTSRAKAYPKQIASAKTLLLDARGLYAAEKWADSRTKAMESIDALKGISGVATTVTKKAAQSSDIVLPRYYKVVSRSKNTDCFWNIAKLPSVYGNPHLWPKLWKANKAKLRNPENPNLIHPGTILEIPPLKNETRDGTYDPERAYPALEE